MGRIAADAQVAGNHGLGRGLLRERSAANQSSGQRPGGVLRAGHDAAHDGGAISGGVLNQAFFAAGEIGSE